MASSQETDPINSTAPVTRTGCSSRKQNLSTVATQTYTMTELLHSNHLDKLQQTHYQINVDTAYI